MELHRGCFNWINQFGLTCIVNHLYWRHHFNENQLLSNNLPFVVMSNRLELKCSIWCAITNHFIVALSSIVHHHFSLPLWLGVILLNIVLCAICLQSNQWTKPAAIALALTLCMYFVAAVSRFFFYHEKWQNICHSYYLNICRHICIGWLRKTQSMFCL